MLHQADSNWPLDWKVPALQKLNLAHKVLLRVADCGTFEGDHVCKLKNWRAHLNRPGADNHRHQGFGRKHDLNSGRYPEAGAE